MVEIKRDLLLIANINSSREKVNRKTIRRANRLKRVGKRKGFEIDVQFTSTPQEAKDILEKTNGDGRAVISFGGDGTLNGLVNAQMEINARTDQENSRVFIVPKVGSTNLLARAIGMPRFRFSARKTIRAIERGLVYKSDLIKVQVDNDPATYAINDVTVGESAKFFEGERPWGRGGKFYLLKLFKVLAGSEYLDADIGFTGEDSTVLRSLRTAVNFTGHNGGILGLFRTNPKKTHDAGGIDALFVHGSRDKSAKATAYKTIRAVLYDFVTGGKPAPSEERIRLDKLAIFVKKNTPFQKDGDWGVKQDGSAGIDKKIVLEIVPKAISVLAPDQEKPTFMRRILKRRAFAEQGEEIEWLKASS